MWQGFVNLTEVYERYIQQLAACRLDRTSWRNRRRYVSRRTLEVPADAGVLCQGRVAERGAITRYIDLAHRKLNTHGILLIPLRHT